MIAGEIDIATASRPIKDSEKADCDKNGIELLELKVALDGLTIAVNHDNNWCAAITVADLKRIWGPDSAVATWKDINPGWPAEDIRLYGPGTESGTFDYFTEVINGKAGQIRSKYDKSADDNVILAGISGDKYAMGFFGCAYYFLNKDKVKAVKVSPTENIADAVELTPDNVLSGTYTPLSRPLMIYVRKSALARHEVSDFVNFFLNDGQAQVTAVNYVRLNAEDLAASREAFEAAIKK